MKMKITWRSFHKYIGVFIALFMIIFCISGIILNHRQLFSGCNISRIWMPEEYKIKNYNNGTVKGTLLIDDDKILIYGSTGIWEAKRNFSNQKDFNKGLPKGMDERNIRNVIKTKDGNLWCATTFGIYKHNGKDWERIILKNNTERIADITLDRDSISVVVATRSHIYSSVRGEENKLISRHLKEPVDLKFEVSLFKSFWMLHSGELFGLPGKLIVDIIAIVLIIISISGIILFILPYNIRRNNRRGNKASTKRLVNLMKSNMRWHNKLGSITIILTIILAFTGSCLRPPLMIPLVMFKTAPLPGSSLDTDNVWHDRLRAIRWDDDSNKWLLSTSEGFFTVDYAFEQAPIKIKKAPPVSPMGVTVFIKQTDKNWLIGSFSGLFKWNLSNGDITDYTTGKKSTVSHGRPVGNTLVSGFSNDTPTFTVFEYGKGAKGLLPMSEELSSQPMSLWNVALELHVGRCYNTFMGPFSDLFVFLFGTLITLVLVSGYIRYRRSYRKDKKRQRTSPLQ